MGGSNIGIVGNGGGGVLNWNEGAGVSVPVVCWYVLCNECRTEEREVGGEEPELGGPELVTFVGAVCVPGSRSWREDRSPPADPGKLY